MSQNTKQAFINRSIDGGTEMKYDQTAAAAAAAAAAALQQSLTLSPSQQLQFMQAAAAAAASPQSMSLSLPWMLPQYQMMVLPDGVSQSLMIGGQNLVTLPDGRVMLAPTSEDGSGVGQMLSSEDVASAEAMLRQQLLRQQQAVAATSQAESAQQQQQLLYQQQLQAQQQQQALLAGLNVSQAYEHQQQQQSQAAAVARVQSGGADNSRTDLPPQPKKPLTPYMMFSKAIWPQVKAANSHLSSVCEIGAVIGSLWRDLDPTEKQKYNDQFARDKERYDNELRAYLKSTGLHASDLVKAKAKRKDARSNSTSMTHINHSVGNVQLGLSQLANATAARTAVDQIAAQQNVPAALSAAQQQELLAAQLALVQGNGGEAVLGQQIGADKSDIPMQLWQLRNEQQGSSGAASVTEHALLQAQVIQLREALSEKTNEVLRLNHELEIAQRTIEVYRAQLAVGPDSSALDTSAGLMDGHTAGIANGNGDEDVNRINESSDNHIPEALMEADNVTANNTDAAVECSQNAGLDQKTVETGEESKEGKNGECNSAIQGDQACIVVKPETEDGADKSKVEKKDPDVKSLDSSNTNGTDLEKKLDEKPPPEVENKE